MTLLGQKVRKWGDRALSVPRPALVVCEESDAEGASDDMNAELMEGLIRQRLKMFEPHIGKWMQVCREWHPEQGLQDDVIDAVRSLVKTATTTTRPMTTVMAVAAAKRWRKSVMISKLKVSDSPKESEDGFLPPISPRRPSLLQLPSSHPKDRRSAHNRSQSHSPSLLSPRSPSMSPITRPRESFRWMVQREQNMSAEVTDLLRNLFLNRLCDALYEMASKAAAGDLDWDFVSRGVQLMHWICRQSAALRTFCETKQIVHTLICFCEYAPPTDITRILTLVSALRTFLCSSETSEEVQAQRIAEAARADFFAAVVKRLGVWMDCAIILHKKEKACRANQLLDCLHDLVLELLKHETMRTKAIDADFVPAFYSLIKERLLTEPLVWPRSLPILMDAVTALPRTEYVQCGIELSKVLRHSNVHKGIDTLPSVLRLRMNTLRRSPVPTPEGSEQGDALLRPSPPTGPSPSCRSPLTSSSHRQRRRSDSEVVGAKRRRGSEPPVQKSARHRETDEAVCAPPVLSRTPPVL